MAKGQVAGCRGGQTQRISLDAAAGEVSAELARRGVPAEARGHVLVEILAEEQEALPMAAMAASGRGFDWLAEEPDLCTDADGVVCFITSVPRSGPDMAPTRHRPGPG